MKILNNILPKQKKTKMFNAYYWKGKAIRNIEEWAANRLEKMVNVVWEHNVPNLSSGAMEKYTTKSTMPESFWNTLRIDPERDGYPLKVTKREPNLTQTEGR